MDLPDYPLFYLKKIQLGGESQYALFAKETYRRKHASDFMQVQNIFTKLSQNTKTSIMSKRNMELMLHPGTELFPFKTNHITNTQRQTFPLTMMNEPREDETANVNLIVQDFLTEEIDFSRENAKFHNIEKDTDKGPVILWRGLAAYTCCDVKKHEELTWYYGKHYAPIRKKKKYTAGKDCDVHIPDDSKGVLKPKHDMLNLKRGVPAKWVFPIYTRVRSEREDEFIKKRKRQKRRRSCSDSGSESD